MPGVVNEMVTTLDLVNSHPGQIKIDQSCREMCQHPDCQARVIHPRRKRCPVHRGPHDHLSPADQAYHEAHAMLTPIEQRYHLIEETERLLTESTKLDGTYRSHHHDFLNHDRRVRRWSHEYPVETPDASLALGMFHRCYNERQTWLNASDGIAQGLVSSRRIQRELGW